MNFRPYVKSTERKHLCLEEISLYILIYIWILPNFPLITISLRPKIHRLDLELMIIDFVANKTKLQYWQALASCHYHVYKEIL